MQNFSSEVTDTKWRVDEDRNEAKDFLKLQIGQKSRVSFYDHSFIFPTPFSSLVINLTAMTRFNLPLNLQ
jgi:hypothetical protein